MPDPRPVCSAQRPLPIACPIGHLRSGLAERPSLRFRLAQQGWLYGVRFDLRAEPEIVAERDAAAIQFCTALQGGQLQVRQSGRCIARLQLSELVETAAGTYELAHSGRPARLEEQTEYALELLSADGTPIRFLRRAAVILLMWPSATGWLSQGT